MATPPPVSASTTLLTTKGEKYLLDERNNERPISDSSVFNLLKGKAVTGDTALFSGNRDDYRISDNQDGTYSVASLKGTDTVSNIQNLQFNDGYVLLIT